MFLLRTEDACLQFSADEIRGIYLLVSSEDGSGHIDIETDIKEHEERVKREMKDEEVNWGVRTQTLESKNYIRVLESYSM